MTTTTGIKDKAKFCNGMIWTELFILEKSNYGAFKVINLDHKKICKAVIWKSGYSST